MNVETPILVCVPASWRAFADPELARTCEQSAETQLEALLAHAGVPCTTRVSVQPTSVDTREHLGRPDVQVRVGADTWRCAPELAARVQAATLQTALALDHFQTPEWLRDTASTPRAADRAVRYVATLCVELCKQHLPRLVRPSAVETIAADMALDGVQVEHDRLRDLANVLRQVLENRGTLGDRALLAAQWRDAAHGTCDQIAESVLDALDRREVRVHVSRTTLRQLTLDPLTDATLARRMRDDIHFELGIASPEWRFAIDDRLPDHAFAVEVEPWPMLVQFGLRPGEYAARAPQKPTTDDASVPDDPSRRGSVLHPITMRSHRLLDAEDARSDGQAIGPFEYILMCLYAMLREASPCFIRRDRVTRVLNSLTGPDALLARALRARWPDEQLTRVLRLLAAERVNIRDLQRIVQCICDFDYIVVQTTDIAFDDRLPVAQQPSDAWLSDPRTLSAFVRTGLRRQITRAALGDASELRVTVASNDLERELHTIARADTWPNDPGQFDDAKRRALLRGLSQLHWSPENRDRILLTGAQARPVLRELLAEVWPSITVLAYQELTADVAIRVLDGPPLRLDDASDTDIRRSVEAHAT